MYDECREDLFYFIICKRSGTIVDKFPHTSYEDALEKGLIKGLKLINK